MCGWGSYLIVALQGLAVRAGSGIARASRGDAGAPDAEPASVGEKPLDAAEIEEMFAALGPVTIRRMFGGKGIYHRGRIVAIELRDGIVLKADAVSAPDFEAAGARRWAYEGRRGKAINMPYWSIPDEAFDDPDVMARWVRLADEAAVRAAKP